MQKINITVVMYILFLVFLLNVSYSDSKANAPVNIVVIIDTSDRVSKKRHSDQRERDIYILKEIVDRFYELVNRNDIMRGIFKLHKLTVVVPEQPKVSSPPNRVMEELTVTAPENREQYKTFLNREERLKSAIEDLYDYVQQHPQTGSDIWDWFRSQAAPSFSEDHQNLIICLSDGYLNFDIDIEKRRRKGTYMRVGVLRDDPEAENKIKNGNEGLFPVGNFSDFNIKFLMLEIRLREENGVKHSLDFGNIQAYWKTWLNAMGINDTKFFEHLNPRALKNVIDNFIQSK